MRRLIDISALTIEFIKYFLSPSQDGGQSRIVFCDALLDRVAKKRVRQQSRPFILGYVVVSALNGRSYSTAFRALKAFGQEVPWEKMSSPLLRRIFEVAVIHDELLVAQRALNELSSRRQLSVVEAESLKCLVAWRAGQIEDESSINLNYTYFVTYPAYDEYFKGRISSDTGRLSEAREHFQRCLTLAPPDALELREDVLRRM